MTHPLDSEVSLHYWLLWPIVSRHCPLAPSILPKSIATPTIDAPDEYSFSKNCTNRGPPVFVQATLKHWRSLKRTQKIFQKKSICNGAVIKMEEDQYLTQNGLLQIFSCKNASFNSTKQLTERHSAHTLCCMCLHRCYFLAGNQANSKN